MLQFLVFLIVSFTLANGEQLGLYNHHTVLDAFAAQPINNVENPNNAIAYNINCPENNFLHCQLQFNNVYNIAPNDDWRNILDIEKTVFTNLMISKKTFLTGCQARKQFYQCNGDKYTTCINRYHLFSRVTNTADIPAAYAYPAFWNRFDFICGGGFGIAIDEFYALTSLKAHSDAEQCALQFGQNMANQLNSLCDNTQTYMTCMQTHFIANSDKTLGWFACEDARTSFALDCPNLRCTIY
uniref:DUF19 domain-containing protein n=1 Tax=Rhabditophanes sp. KR3021 TaxID=114890 RepID=A0AC35UES1_9BILA